MDSDVSFSRVSRTGDELAELRVNLPKVLLGVIDMVASAEADSTGKMVSRTDIVHRVLSKFVDEKVHEAMLINRAMKDYPTVMEGSGND